MVGNREAVVDINGPAEAPALRTRAQRRIEGEQRRGGGAKGAAGPRRMQAAGEVADLFKLPAGGRCGRRGEQPDFPLSEMEGGFDRFTESRLPVGRQRDAVLDDEQMRGVPQIEGRRPGGHLFSSCRHQLSIAVGHENAAITLALQAGKNLRPAELAGSGDFKRDYRRAAGMRGRHLRPDRLRVVILDLLAGFRIETFCDVAEPDFEEIGQFRHRAHGGARSLHRVGLLDGDGGPDVLDGLDQRLGQKLEELAGIGAEGLGVAALALGVQRVENQRGLARSAQAGDYDVFSQREIEVEALKVVLPDAPQPDESAGMTVSHGRNR